MKKIIYLLVILTIVSCEKETSNSAPAYLKIDDITLSGSNSTEKITDAWVYINDQLQGVYQLPALFPVLETNEQKVRIKAGIKANGIASSRLAYPFYASFIETVQFSDDSIIVLEPTVSYIDSVHTFVEDFEGIGLDLETTPISDTSIVVLSDNNNNRYASGILTDSLYIFEVATDELKGLPQAGAPVFLELDYKSNTTFLVGVYVNYPQSVIQKDLLWVNPKEDWNKIYVNLTQTISEGINASSFKVFIGMRRDFSKEQNEVNFDNLKVVY